MMFSLGNVLEKILRSKHWTGVSQIMFIDGYYILDFYLLVLYLVNRYFANFFYFKGVCYGNDITVMTSHLESTAPEAPTRKRQLLQVCS